MREAKLKPERPKPAKQCQIIAHPLRRIGALRLIENNQIDRLKTIEIELALRNARI